MSINNTHSLKVVLLGDTSVGKSSVTLRFTKNEYHEFQEPTIGAAFINKNLNYNNYNVKFEMWDTAGQERYNSLAPMYYRGANIAIIVYDVTNPESFIKAKKWVRELKNNVENIHIILAGNKCDLVNICDQNDIKNYVIKNNFKHYFISAKKNINIEKLFYEIGKNKTLFNKISAKKVNSINHELNNRSCISNSTSCC